MFLELAKHFDVIIENFRPGTLERWGIGPEDLERAGANVVLLRISGYGQTGPKKDLPGFGTVAEATSGFAHLNGFPSGPPTFPSTTLGDGVASLFGVIGVLASLVNRKGGPRGVEVIDVALFEALFRIIPTQVAAYDQLSACPERPGNFLGSHGVLRNAYKSIDDRWICVSAVGTQAIRKIMLAAEAADLIVLLDDDIMNHPDGEQVQEFLSACNIHLEAWTAKLPFAELMRLLQKSDAVHSAIYSMREISEDEQYKARNNLVEVPDGDLGDITMQGIVPKFPAREHVVRHAGRSLGQDNASIYSKYLGISLQELEQLKKEGVV
jgi:formyl-CoA transferase